MAARAGGAMLNGFHDQCDGARMGNDLLKLNGGGVGKQSRHAHTVFYNRIAWRLNPASSNVREFHLAKRN